MVEELTGELKTPRSGYCESLFCYVSCQLGLLNIESQIEKEVSFVLKNT